MTIAAFCSFHEFSDQKKREASGFQFETVMFIAPLIVNMQITKKFNRVRGRWTFRDGINWRNYEL
jgi:hypothetical protein